MRGITAEPKAMVESFDFAQRVTAATEGKLTLKDLETVARQVKYGAGAQIDEEGWSQIYAFANQLKASGHGGGGGGGVEPEIGRVQAGEGGVGGEVLRQVIDERGLVDFEARPRLPRRGNELRERLFSVRKAARELGRERHRAGKASICPSPWPSRPQGRGD